MEPIHIHRGFTLIELIVVVAIMGTVMAVVITSQGSFNKTLILANTAYDVALTVYSAETYGIGGRAVAGVQNVGYGVNFNKATKNAFTFFADTSPAPSATNCHGLPAQGAGAPDAKSGDCVYTPGQDQNINTYTIGNAITVSDFCVYSAGTSSWSCATSGGMTLSTLAIVFIRPNPIPFISINGIASQTSYQKACITLTSVQGGGANRFLFVGKSGEIRVTTTSCIL